MDVIVSRRYNEVPRRKGINDFVDLRAFFVDLRVITFFLFIFKLSVNVFVRFSDS